MESEVGMEQLVQALPLEERVPILALKHYYDQRSQLDQEQEMQLELARRKYDDRVKPLLERAAQLIQGSIPKQEEVALLQQYVKPGQKLGPLKGKAIENYWVSAMQNSPLEPFLTEKDEGALENLLNIQSVKQNKNDSSINFKFTFKSNPYFQQTTAIRRLIIEDGKAVSLEGDVMTPKQGNWLTHEMRKVNNKSTGETKIMQGKKIESFFDIFINWSIVDNPKMLAKCTKIFEGLNEVYRDSFSCFLGLYENDVSEDLEEQYDDQDLEEEESNQKKKK